MRPRLTKAEGIEILEQFKRYAIYIRVSLEKQVEEGDSIETQEAMARAIVDANEGQLVDVYIDPGISASKTDMEDRPELMRLLADAKEGRYDAVIVFKRDRLARNPEHAARIRSEFKKHKIQVIYSAPGEMVAQANDPMGDYIEGIFALNNAFESAITSQRVTSVMLNKAKKGDWSGGTVPFGYRRIEAGDEKVFVLVPDEVAVIHEVEDLYLKGMGEQGITKWLNGDEVRYFGRRPGGKGPKLTDRSGNVAPHWTREMVRWILDNPWYCGYVTYNKQAKEKGRRFRDAEEWVKVKGTHPIVRTEERHQEIQDVRVLRSERITSPRFYSTDYLLTGLLYCACCDTPLGTRNTTKGKAGKEYNYYLCHTKSNHPGRTKCTLPIYQKGLLEDFVITQVCQYAEGLDIDSLAQALESSKKETSNTSLQELKMLEEHIAKLERRRKSNMEEIEDTDDREYKQELRERQKELRAELDEARQRKASLEHNLAADKDDYLTLRRVYDLLKEFPKAIRTCPVSLRKALLEQVIERVSIHPSGQTDITFRVHEPVPMREVSAFGVSGNPHTLKTLTVTLNIGHTITPNVHMWAHTQHSKASNHFRYWIRREGARVLGKENAGDVSGCALATFLGVQQPQVSRYFKGTFPMRERFEHICQQFGVDPQAVYGQWEMEMSYDTFFDMVNSPKRERPTDHELYYDRERNNEKCRRYKERKRLGLVDTNKPAPGRKKVVS